MLLLCCVVLGVLGALQTLTEQCERYSGDELLSYQDSLRALLALQDSWVEAALRVLRRHPGPDGAPPRGQEALMELDRVVSELHLQLETRANGESGQSHKYTNTHTHTHKHTHTHSHTHTLTHSHTSTHTHTHYVGGNECFVMLVFRYL